MRGKRVAVMSDRKHSILFLALTSKQAEFLRTIGLRVVVWQTMDESSHKSALKVLKAVKLPEHFIWGPDGDVWPRYVVDMLDERSTEAIRKAFGLTRLIIEKKD